MYIKNFQLLNTLKISRWGIVEALKGNSSPLNTWCINKHIHLTLFDEDTIKLSKYQAKDSYISIFDIVKPKNVLGYVWLSGNLTKKYKGKKKKKKRKKKKK